jgi:hypothetical protein
MAKLDKPASPKDDEVAKTEPTAPESAPAPEASATIAAKTTPEKTGRFAKFKAVLKSRYFRIGLAILLLAAAAVVAFVEPVKLAAMNLFTDGKVEFVVVDDVTLVPIQKATVSIGGKTAETDKAGKATIDGVDFGTAEYSVHKEIYDKVTGDTKIKPGDNLVGPVKLHSDGIPVQVTATNLLSKEAVKTFAV